MWPWVAGTPACSGPRLTEGSLVTGTILGATDNRERETKTCRPRKRFCCSGRRSAGADATGKNTEGQSWRGEGGLCQAGRDHDGERGGRAEPRSAHALLLPPSFAPGPLCPPVTGRAHPGRLGSCLGAGAMPAHGWAQGSGCSVPTASASPVPGTRAPSRYLVITDATTFYFNLSRTRYGYPHVSTGVCV